MRSNWTPSRLAPEPHVGRHTAAAVGASVAANLPVFVAEGVGLPFPGTTVEDLGVGGPEGGDARAFEHEQFAVVGMAVAVLPEAEIGPVGIGSVGTADAVPVEVGERDEAVGGNTACIQWCMVAEQFVAVAALQLVEAGIAALAVEEVVAVFAIAVAAADIVVEFAGENVVVAGAAAQDVFVGAGLADGVALGVALGLDAGDLGLDVGGDDVAVDGEDGGGRVGFFGGVEVEGEGVAGGIAGERLVGGGELQGGVGIDVAGVYEGEGEFGLAFNELQRHVTVGKADLVGAIDAGEAGEIAAGETELDDVACLGRGVEEALDGFAEVFGEVDMGCLRFTGAADDEGVAVRGLAEGELGTALEIDAECSVAEILDRGDLFVARSGLPEDGQRIGRARPVAVEEVASLFILPKGGTVGGAARAFIPSPCVTIVVASLLLTQGH
ncbi:hypothetical protein [Candidatus Accumulibacter phosphatis]|uniref:Uncharacterized protein n=1 Tax=Candidatus Accumulibacter phosphatis TaxID=327160 RepID=A0A5S4EPJ3_9PROT|nr:hypothetical protein [Candidatus Accumulibacter phosphatis]TMQ77359.1 hypothetical protein ACCUM_3199 [Candidatus Accumulibacter phosphatis]